MKKNNAKLQEESGTAGLPPPVKGPASRRLLRPPRSPTYLENGGLCAKCWGLCRIERPGPKPRSGRTLETFTRWSPASNSGSTKSLRCRSDIGRTKQKDSSLAALLVKHAGKLVLTTPPPKKKAGLGFVPFRVWPLGQRGRVFPHPCRILVRPECLARISPTRSSMKCVERCGLSCVVRADAGSGVIWGPGLNLSASSTCVIIFFKKMAVFLINWYTFPRRMALKDFSLAS